MNYDELKRKWSLPENDRKRKYSDIESVIQQSCVKWFRYQYSEYTTYLRAIPNGGHRAWKTGGILKKEGVLRGTADLILFLARKQYHTLHIEMKKPKIGESRAGVQTNEQKQYQKDMEKENHMYAICHTLDEFMQLINWYLN